MVMGKQNIVKMLLLIVAIIVVGIDAVAWAAVDASNTQDSTVFSDWHVSGNVQSEGSYYHHDGPGSTPAQDEEWEFRHEASIRAEGPINDATVGVEIAGRFTDDEQIDPHRGSLQYLHLFYDATHWLYELGDVAATLNPLVFSGGVQGAKVSYSQAAEDDYDQLGWNSTVIAGTQQASWREIFEQTRTSSADRYTAAGEVRYRYSIGQEVAASVSSAYDRASSVDDEFAVIAGNAVTGGIDWEWRFNKYISTRGEIAFTATDPDKKDDSDRNTHKAVKIKILTKPIPRKLSSDFDYEYIEKGFDSLVGSASNDVHRWANNTTWRISREWQLRMNLRCSENNLEEHLEGTTAIDEQLLECVYRPDFFKRGELRLRSQRRKTRGVGTNAHYVEEVNFSTTLIPGLHYSTSWLWTAINSKIDASDSHNHTFRHSVQYSKYLSEAYRFASGVTCDYNFMQSNGGSDQDIFGLSCNASIDYKRVWELRAQITNRNTWREAADANTYYTTCMLSSTYWAGEKRNHIYSLIGESRTYQASSSANTYDEQLVRASYTWMFGA